MPYDANREEGWSAQKCAVFWIGGILLAMVVATMAILISANVNEQNIQKWQACLDSGSTPLECKAAIY